MSFYGNIAYLSKGFKEIKVGDTSFTAKGFEDIADLTESLNELYGISLSEAKEIDNELNYTLKQGEKEIGIINVPLDQILENVELKEKDNKHYLVFYFRTEETEREPIWLDVSLLNEIAGDATTTIEVEVSSDQKITAKIIDKSVNTDKLADSSVTEVKLADGAVTKNKLDTNLLDKISKSVQFSYDEKNKRLKISYSKEENDNGTTV